MQHKDTGFARSACAAAVAGVVDGFDKLEAKGVYVATLCDKDGNVKWTDTFSNLVTTAGKNDMLDKYLAGSAYTAAFYMGLISSVSYAAGVNVADTMASHAGWLEAGGTNAPAYAAGSRPTAAWSAASAGVKALSASLSFTFSSGGTVKGSFLTTVATKDGTTGILLSAGLFTGGDKVVAASDVLNVSYSLGV